MLCGNKHRGAYLIWRDPLFLKESSSCVAAVKLGGSQQAQGVAYLLLNELRASSCVAAVKLCGSHKLCGISESLKSGRRLG